MRARIVRTVALVSMACASRAAAQGAFDRKLPPPVPRLAAFRPPAWSRTTLPDGAELIVSERHGLPLIAVTIAFQGGANQFEPADKRGVATFAASMLSEGTTTRTGDQLSEALQLLGADITSGVAGESGSIGFFATKDKLAPVLAILADELLHPTFPADALERLRARTLVALQQQRDQTGVVAGNVFARTVYGDAHPYGRVLTAATVKSITRDDIVAFHRMFYQPGRAIITVVGDVDPAAVRATIGKALSQWKAGGEKATFAYPALATARATTIYLVDKPGAAQSSFAIGQPGPPRDTRDYFPLQVMNTILGVLFPSRLNANIREVHGYSYGVGSSYAYGKGPGAFRAGGDIVTAKSDSALIEFVKELRGVQGGRPFTDEELRQAKDALIQRLPQSFGSVLGTSGQIGALYLQGLPEDYFRTYAANVEAVTKDDLVRVAKQYIDLDHLAIVIVGDRTTINAPLKATGIAPIVLLDLDGNPVTGGP